ncbi:MAG: methyltransferase domain-containing protein [Chloroflexota bacterium]
MATVDARELRGAMVNELKKRGLELEPTIEEVFRTIPREVFLPDAPLERVYSGDAVITKQDEEGSPISSSSEVGIMIAMAQLLDVSPGQRILEIGAGTGYNAAVLAQLVGERGAITTIDIDDDVAALARAHLARAGFDRVAVITADGWRGNAANAPYDRIEVTASVADLSPDWIAQLVDDGKIVLPFVLRAGMQAVLGLRKQGKELVSTRVVPGGFMRLRGPAGPRPQVHSFDDWSVELGDGVLDRNGVLPSLLRETPRFAVAPPLGWEPLILLALLYGNVTVTREGHPGLAVGIFDPDGGLAVVELAGRSIAGPVSLVIAFGSDPARSRLLFAIEELRTIRLKDLQVVARPSGSPAPEGDVVLRRESFTFAFRAPRSEL